MKKLLSIIIVTFLCQFTNGQMSISGPTCALPNTNYTYTISGNWTNSTSMTWSVTHGTIIGSSSGTPRPQITVSWSSSFSSGTVSLTTSNPSSNPSLSVTIVPSYNPGTISNPSQ